MAIFQPSNVIPSTFAGVGDSTVDVSENINISWQVNGNSPMTAFKIAIYDNASSSTTPVNTPTVVDISSTPFNAVDNKGNPQQFTYAPTSTTWASWGLTNGNEYKMVITQYWGTDENTDFTQNVATSVEQWSGTVFKTRATPTLTLSLTEGGSAWSGATAVGAAVQTFYGNYSQAQNDSINSVRWQIGTVDSISGTITDGDVSILDDTGVINTQVLSYKYNGFFNTNTTEFPKYYAIKCTVQTENGVEVSAPSTGWIGFNVVYTQATNTGDLTLTCQEDSSVLLSWGKALDIPGTLSPSGTPSISGGVLSLSSSESVEWNTVNDESMSFAPDYSVGQKAQVAKYLQKNETIVATPSITTETDTFTGNPDNYYLDSCDFVSSASMTGGYLSPFVFNGNYGLISSPGFIGTTKYTNDGGINWYSIPRPNTSNLYLDSIGFGNNYFLGTAAYGQDNHYFLYSQNASDWSVGTVDRTYYGIKWKGFLYHRQNNFSIAIGQQPNNTAIILSTTNGKDWTKISTIPLSTFSSAIYGNGLFIITDSYSSVVDSQTKIYFRLQTSPDGINWTTQNIDFSIETSSQTAIGSKVLYYKNKFYLYIRSLAGSYSVDLKNDYNYYLFTSTNGTDWEQINQTNISFISIGFNSLLGVFDGKIVSSIDGINPYRTIYTPPATNSSFLYSLEQVNNHFVAYGRGGIDGLQYSTNEIYFFESNYNPQNKWYNSATVSQSSSNFTSFDVLNQENYQDNLTIRIFGNSYEQISAILDMTFYSTTSAGSLIVSDITYGVISKVYGLSTTPNATFGTITNTADSYTIPISVPTASGSASETPVTATIQIVYDLNLADSQTVVESNNLSFDFQLDNDGTPYKYGLSVKNKDDNSFIVPAFKIQPTNGTYTLNYKFLLTPTKIYFMLVDNNNNLLGSYEQSVSYTQTAITEISMAGNQVIDWLYIRQNGDTLTADYTPIWDNNTLFLANFVEGLQAGTSSEGAQKNSIFRFNTDKSLLQPIFDIPTQYNQLKDYGVKSLSQYYYELFYLRGTSFSEPVKSDNTCRQFKGYYLIEATQYESEMSDYPNVYHVVKVWRFQNNVSSSAISNNNTPNWLTNFTRYRLRQPSSRLGESGTLQALLSNYDLETNTYVDTAEMMKDLKEASISNNTFFLKDMKGNLYMVGISAPITQTINTISKVQEVKVSVPWEETEDASDVALIQVPTDSGWNN